MSAAVAGARAPLLPMLAAQTRAEFLKLWRVPAFSATSLLLPVMFYAFIGLQSASQQIRPGVSFGAYFLASMAAYAVSNMMVFSFGIQVANERGMKMDLLQRATPMPTLLYLTAKVLNALGFSLLALVILLAFAYFAGGVHLSAGTYLQLTWRLLLGSLAFVAVGFAMGYLSGPNSAVAVVNLIYLPTAFASGLFFPLQLLPDFIRRLAPYLPLYRYGQLGYDAVGVKLDDPLLTDWLYLGAYAAVFFALALWAFRQEEARKFS
ncbi:MAG TPA: ABC transporter permease [Candidatus Acidoferrales bacterium]|nr:ABC transporter permease [Candidatus Acidoferrales bacterium]